MSEDSNGDDATFDRRSILRNAAAGVAGVGGLALAAGSSDARELPSNVKIRGDLDTAEVAALIQKDDGYEPPSTADDCEYEYKCGDGCSGQGAHMRRQCCIGLGCGDWEWTGYCC